MTSQFGHLYKFYFPNKQYSLLHLKQKAQLSLLDVESEHKANFKNGTTAWDKGSWSFNWCKAL